MQSSENCVCLVQKANGQLGFPKGGAEPSETSMLCCGQMTTAMREWQVETNPPTEGFTLMDAPAGVHVDQYNCHYFMAKWDRTKLPPLPGDIQPANVAGVMTSWKITDVPRDRDTIVETHWMECQEALAHPRLSDSRRHILLDGAFPFLARV